MTPRDSLALDRLARARESLAEADALIEAARHRGAINRLYYAAFYAARALLALRDLDSSRHSRIISMFQQHFVQNGIVAADTARALPRAFEKRLRSDYDDFVEAPAAEVERLRTEVVSFVIACEQAVQRLIQA